MTDNTKGKGGVRRQGVAKAGGDKKGKAVGKRKDESMSITVDSEGEKSSKGTLCVSIVCQLCDDRVLRFDLECHMCKVCC